MDKQKHQKGNKSLLSDDNGVNYNEVAQRLGLIGKRSVGKLTLLKYGAGAKCCEFNKLLGEQTK